MAHDVFISHAHKDKSIAEAICKRLESGGIRCWMTVRDISLGEDWTNATLRAIGSSSVMLLLFSENANSSPHLAKEIAHAYYTRRIIIALRLSSTPPRRDFLFYLNNVRWFEVLNPSAEEQLDALIAHIKGLMPVGSNVSPQGAGRATTTLNSLSSRIGAIGASNYRTVEILKWTAIATCLLAAGGLLWLVLREPKERTSLAENEPRLIHPGSTVFPKPSPQAGGNASSPAPTYNFAGLSLWQPASIGPTPSAHGEPEAAPLTGPAEDSASVTPSPPAANVAQEGRAGLNSTSDSHSPVLPPTGTHEAPHRNHQAYQGLGTLEAHKNAALQTRERDALENQLKEVEAKLQTTQKSADILATQRDELERELEESEARAQTAQKNADIAASERDALRNQLKETENRAITAQNNDELATGDFIALIYQREVSLAKPRPAQNAGDFA
jgi:hypothetical protein